MKRSTICFSLFLVLIAGCRKPALKENQPKSNEIAGVKNSSAAGFQQPSDQRHSNASNAFLLNGAREGKSGVAFLDGAGSGGILFFKNGLRFGYVAAKETDKVGLKLLQNGLAQFITSSTRPSAYVNAFLGDGTTWGICSGQNPGHFQFNVIGEYQVVEFEFEGEIFTFYELTKPTTTQTIKAEIMVDQFETYDDFGNCIAFGATQKKLSLNGVAKLNNDNSFFHVDLI